LYKTLDQFIQQIIVYFNIFEIYLFISDLEIIYFYIFFILFFFFLVYGIFNLERGVPSVLILTVQLFIQQLIEVQIDKKAQYYYILIFCIFVFILFANYLGLIPGLFCLSSQLGFTTCLSFSIFGGVIFFIIKWFGLNYFFSLFIPQNIPQFIKYFLIVIEIVSFSSRAISLSVRLFANMVAGHSLLYILLNALTVIFKSLKVESLYFTLLLFVPLIIIYVIYSLEMGIGFLQAYVFIVLSLIYLRDSLKHAAH